MPFILVLLCLIGKMLIIRQISYEHNLVQMGENVRQDPAFMCNCCGCCCEALGAAKKFSPMQPIASSNYLPAVTAVDCVGCGKCSKVCPIDAITMVEKDIAANSMSNDFGAYVDLAAGTGKSGKCKRMPVIDESICLGCGVCARNCHKKAIVLNRRPVQVITPVNSTHRYVLEAIEKGTLQNLIFDNQAFANHRAMAAVLGVILKLPPMKQALASKQFKSVYLDKLLSIKIS